MRSAIWLATAQPIRTDMRRRWLGAPPCKRVVRRLRALTALVIPRMACWATWLGEIITILTTFANSSATPFPSVRYRYVQQACRVTCLPFFCNRNRPLPRSVNRVHPCRVPRCQRRCHYRKIHGLAARRCDQSVLVAARNYAYRRSRIKFDSLDGEVRKCCSHRI